MTWVYIILVYMHHTKLCIVAITEIRFYEKIPNVRQYIKTKPLPLLTPLKVHCLYTFVSRIINISITGGYFLRHPPFSSLFFQISLSLITEKIACNMWLDGFIYTCCHYVTWLLFNLQKFRFAIIFLEIKNRFKILFPMMFSQIQNKSPLIFYER